VEIDGRAMGLLLKDALGFQFFSATPGTRRADGRRFTSVAHAEVQLRQMLGHRQPRKPR